MQINVSQLLQEPVGAIRNCQVNETADIIGDNKQYNVQGECSLLRLQGSILVKCALKTEVELDCSRCLSRFRYPLRMKFEEEYVPTIDVLTGAQLPQPEETSTFTIDEHHILDLEEAVHQYAMLAIPMKPLCDKECAGMCPTCGKNLNEGKCDCPQQEIDPRWSELTKLL
jgi:uncharacterized protein